MPLKARNTVSQDYSLMMTIQASFDLKSLMRYQLSLIMVNDVFEMKESSFKKVTGLIFAPCLSILALSNKQGSVT